jgi:hypothetical protein
MRVAAGADDLVNTERIRPMLAMNCRGPYRVRVSHKAEPQTEHPNDAIVRVTRSCICGACSPRDEFFRWRSTAVPSPRRPGCGHSALTAPERSSTVLINHLGN